MFFHRLQDTKENLGVYMGLEVLLPKSIISREIHTLYIIYHENQQKSMIISRSEAVDKSPGVFFDAEYDFNGPGT